MQYFLLQLALLLAAAALAAPLGKQLKVGSVLGYLAAGIVIGPHALGIFHQFENILEHRRDRRGHAALPDRPRAAPAAPVGDAQRRSAWAAPRWRRPPSSAALLASLTDSNRAARRARIVAVLDRLRAADAEGARRARYAPGRFAFAILLFQDIAAIPMIALVGLFSPGGAAAMSPWSALGGLLAIGAIILAGRFLLTRLYRFVAATGLQEAMTATALLTVIVIVIVMNAAGLSAALGAFIAGLVLAESPNTAMRSEPTSRHSRAAARVVLRRGRHVGLDSALLAALPACHRARPCSGWSPSRSP